MIVVSGNLITLADNGEFDIIVHGCNCMNVMGSGIAVAIRNKWPEAFYADQNFGTPGDYCKLGNFSSAEVKSKAGDLTIINAYTQYKTNNGGVIRDVFEYTSFSMILQKLLHLHPSKRYGFPLIGCGLAGGDKIKIISMIDDFANLVEQRNGSVTLVDFNSK